MFSNGGLVQLLTKKIYQWSKTEKRRYTYGFFAMGNSCNHLGIPAGKGPYTVGCTDLMMDHTARGTFFRLYYPGQEVENALKPDWIPCREYFNGLADFMKINRTLSERIFNYLFGSFKIPAYLDKLIEINSGIAVQNVLQTQFDWTTLENSMDLCRIAAMGHSFGGATVIEALCKEVKFKCAIALDAWMVPLEEEIFPQVKQPIFFINSEKFQWVGNIIRMKKLESAAIQRKMITIRGAVHQSFPDFTFLTGNWIGKLMKLKGEIDPELAMDLCNKASLAFLQRHLGMDKDFNQWDPLIDGQDDNLIPGTNVHISAI